MSRFSSHSWLVLPLSPISALFFTSILVCSLYWNGVHRCLGATTESQYLSDLEGELYSMVIKLLSLWDILAYLFLCTVLWTLLLVCYWVYAIKTHSPNHCKYADLAKAAASTLDTSGSWVEMTVVSVSDTSGFMRCPLRKLMPRWGVFLSNIILHIGRNPAFQKVILPYPTRRCSFYRNLECYSSSNKVQLSGLSHGGKNKCWIAVSILSQCAWLLSSSFVGQMELSVLWVSSSPVKHQWVKG